MLGRRTLENQEPVIRDTRWVERVLRTACHGCCRSDAGLEI